MEADNRIFLAEFNGQRQTDVAETNKWQA